MDNFILILIYLSLGFAMRRVPKFPTETPVVLNTFVMYVALPALVLQKIPSLHFSWDLLIPALVPWILLLLVSALILVLGRLLHWSRDIIVALLIVLPLGNTSFLGFPMIEALFGGDWLPYAMIYDQIGLICRAGDLVNNIGCALWHSAKLARTAAVSRRRK